MKNKKTVKQKIKDNYKTKRRIFLAENSAPFMANFFIKKDAEELIKKFFEGAGCSEELLCMLNNSLRAGANLFPYYNTLSPCKGDEIILLTKLQDNFKQANENLYLLIYRYGYETFRHIHMDREELTTLTNLLQKAHNAMPQAIKLLDETSGKRRGNNAYNAIRSLISSLILVYEKFTGKKAMDNFKQPKADGLDYQGNFYDFCVAVFEMINTNFSDRYGEVENIFHIQTNDSLSLGSHIRKVLKY